MSEPVTQTRRDRRRIVVVAASVLFAIGALVLWRVSASRRAFDPLAIPEQIPAPLREQHLTREEAWRGASFVRVASGERRSVEDIRSQAREIATQLAPMVDDPDALLSAAQRGALLDRIALEALVRTQADPSGYIALTESSPEYRWIEASEERWRRAGLWTLLDKSGAPMPATTIDACRRLWPETMEAGYRFAAIGVAPSGARIKVGLIRSRSQPFQLDHAYTEGQRHYWLDGPMRGSTFKFREPVKPLEEALRSSDSLVIAESNVLIETENGLLTTWRRFWYFDPEGGRWVCHSDVVAGGRLVKAFF